MHTETFVETNTHTAGFDRMAPTQPKHRHAEWQTANREKEVKREEERVRTQRTLREREREGELKNDGGLGVATKGEKQEND